MRDSELLIDVMQPNTIYTLKDLKKYSSFTIQKTTNLIHKLVERGYVTKVAFDSGIAKQIKFDYGYMLKG